MLTLNGRNIQLGGFHDHWLRNGSDNPTLLMAAMNYYHFDFICLMDGITPKAKWLKQCVESYSREQKVFLGHEKGYGWGHVVTVGCRDEELTVSSDDPDYRSVLKQLREASDLTALAHPVFPFTWETIFLTGVIDELIDEGYVDAVQSCFREEEWDWASKRAEAGLHLPLIQGWDHHLLSPVENLPDVLYQKNQSPIGHIDTADLHRTIVFADDNSQQAIMSAVRAGNSVLDHFGRNEFLGPKGLVQFLEANGYRDAVRNLDAQRDSIRLEKQGKAIAGNPLTLTFSHAGDVIFPGTLSGPLKAHTATDGSFQISELPAILPCNKTHLPVVFHPHDGTERIFAIELNHPINLDIRPLVKAESTFLEISDRSGTKTGVEMTAGVAALGVENAELTPPDSLLPLNLDEDDYREFDYRVDCRSGKINRTFEGQFNRVFAHRSTNGDNWLKSKSVRIASGNYAGGYGNNRPYPGADVFSADLRFGWDEDGLIFQADVIDPIHFQPRSDRMVYQADCLQLAIDPLYGRSELMGEVYVFNLALTPDGPLVWRYDAPKTGAFPGFAPPPPETSLGSDYLTVTPHDNGLTYLLRLPWQELAPVVPESEHRMGIYFIMKNNDGEGLVDSLQWPWPITGMWMRPNLWGTLVLKREST